MDTYTETRVFEEIKFWHQVTLPDGRKTNGVVSIDSFLAYSKLPERMDGLRVLDVGAWDGALSFECERRGAAEVIAADTWDGTGAKWPGDPVNGPVPNRAGFDCLSAILHSKVKAREISVYDLAPENVGTFDLVLAMGLIYHLRHPLMALDRLRSVCGRQLILESHLDMLGIARPACAFYETDENSGDDTNWFGPNIACLGGWIRSSGFEQVEFVGGMNLDSSANPQHFQSGRGTFHAFVDGADA